MRASITQLHTTGVAVTLIFRPNLSVRLAAKIYGLNRYTKTVRYTTVPKRLAGPLRRRSCLWAHRLRAAGVATLEGPKSPNPSAYLPLGRAGRTLTLMSSPRELIGRLY